MKKLFLIFAIISVAISTFAQNAADSADWTTTTTDADYGILFNDSPKKMSRMSMIYYQPWLYVNSLTRPRYITTPVVIGSSKTSTSYMLDVTGNSFFSGDITLPDIRRISFQGGARVKANSLTYELVLTDAINGDWSLGQLSKGGRSLVGNTLYETVSTRSFNFGGTAETNYKVLVDGTLGVADNMTMVRGKTLSLATGVDLSVDAASTQGGSEGIDFNVGSGFASLTNPGGVAYLGILTGFSKTGLYSAPAYDFEGTLYWNLTDHKLKVYDGDTWVDIGIQTKNIKEVQIDVPDTLAGTTITTGWVIPVFSNLNGYDFKQIEAIATSTGTSAVQLTAWRKRGGVEVNMTTGYANFTTPAVFDVDYNDLQTGDWIEVRIAVASGTPPTDVKALLKFQQQ